MLEDTDTNACVCVCVCLHISVCVGVCMLAHFSSHTKPEAPRVVLPSARGPLRVGDRVRVRPNVKRPKFGWSFDGEGLNSIGIVRNLVGPDECRVDFPEFKDWHGYIPEMELVN